MAITIFLSSIVILLITIISSITIPSIDAATLTAIQEFFTNLRDITYPFIGFLLPWNAVIIGLYLVMGIWFFDHGHRLYMYVMRKIPFASIE